MSQATEIYSREFDSIFFGLPEHLQKRIEARIQGLGRHLADFRHHRLQGRPEFRLRVGDYRLIYRFDAKKSFSDKRNERNLLYWRTVVSFAAFRQ